eukprot:1138839-Pelagomonas_calceolata.AAC.8
MPPQPCRRQLVGRWSRGRPAGQRGESPGTGRSRGSGGARAQRQTCEGSACTRMKMSAQAPLWGRGCARAVADPAWAVLTHV